MSGVISSVITNSSAMVALNSLTSIQSELNTVQTQVSTGYRVSSAVDDGAAYAVAQSVRSNVSGLTSANQALGGAQGLLATANTGLTSVSNTMQSIQSTLVQLSSANISADQRSQYTAQYNQQVSEMRTAINGSTYNGKNLINLSTHATSVASDETGTQIELSGFAGSSMVAAMSALGASGTITATVAKAMLSAAPGGGATASTGAFTFYSQNVGTALNTLGNTTNLVSNQITFNTNKIDALNNGVGSLVDANMAQESAKLQSLQIQQQLATSALSIANQAPSILTKLFG